VLVVGTVGAFIVLAGLYLFYFGWPFSAAARIRLPFSPNQLFASAPGVFLVGSGVQELAAPVFLQLSRQGRTIIGCPTYAPLGMTTGGGVSRPGDAGFIRGLAKTGVPAKSNVAYVRAIVACFIE